MTVPRPVAGLALALPWIVALCAAGWLVLQRFPPSGVAHFAFAFDGASPWLDPFLPGQRVTSPGPQPDGWAGQRILDQPVYASARLPGPFDRVDLILEARPIRQPLIELGLLRDPAAFAFEIQPVWSEALSQGWHRVSRGSAAGFVRDGIADTALTANDPERLMVWDASSTSPALMDPAGPGVTYDVSLRGAHDFYLVPTNGSIDFNLLLQDVNRTRGGNVAAFRLSKDDATLWTEAVGSGGSQDTRPDQPFEKDLAFHDLKPGVYRLSLQADDDIFIRRLVTSARHWVIGPRLSFGDTVGYAGPTSPALAWTNSRHLVVETFHPEGLQEVRLGAAKLNLDRTHQTLSLDRLSAEMAGARQFSAPKGDVQLVGDGYFALSSSTLFLPQPRRLTDASHPAEEGVDAVLTPYVPPAVTSDGWIKLESAFDLNGIQSDSLKFTLSAPGIATRGGAVDVRAAELTYTRPALSWGEWWKAVRRELAAAWHRL